MELPIKASSVAVFTFFFFFYLLLIFNTFRLVNPVFFAVKLKLENEDKTISESKTINRLSMHSREAMEHLSKKTLY
jgi:hypothetical protein